MRRAKSQDPGVCTGWARTSPRRPDRLWPRDTIKNVAISDYETGDLSGFPTSISLTALLLLASWGVYLPRPSIRRLQPFLCDHYRPIPIFLQLAQRFSVLTLWRCLPNTLMSSPSAPSSPCLRLTTTVPVRSSDRTLTACATNLLTINHRRCRKRLGHECFLPLCHIPASYDPLSDL